MTEPLLPKRSPGTLPSVALGAMNFGKRTDAAESTRIVRRALERGIRIFDTANAYNAGESERILGRALGKDRQDVVVATKVGMDRIAGRPEGLTKAAIERAITGSLERMKTAWVDVYYLHVPDHATPIEESLGAFAELAQKQLIKGWGVSNYASWQILEMHRIAESIGLAKPVASQVLYNALHREIEVEYFGFARRYPIHTTVYNPLAAGLLTGKHTFDETAPKGSRFDGNAMYQRRYWSRAMFDRTAALALVAQDAGMSLLQLAYAFIASRSDVDSVLVGPATVAHLDDALDALALPLTEDVKRRIDALAIEWAGSDTHYVR